MASDCGLILEKDNCVNEFNLKAWLKPYINMGVKLKAKPKNDFTKDFFKLMNNPVFGKTTENVKNHRDINLVTTNKRRNKLLSESNYHTTNHFSKILLSIKMNETNKKKQASVSKSVYSRHEQKSHVRLISYWISTRLKKIFQ